MNPNLNYNYKDFLEELASKKDLDRLFGFPAEFAIRAFMEREITDLRVCDNLYEVNIILIEPEVCKGNCHCITIDKYTFRNVLVRLREHIHILDRFPTFRLFFKLKDQYYQVIFETLETE